MRSLLSTSLIVIALLTASLTAIAQTHLRMSTTTSTENSGLLKVLLPPFEAKCACKVDVIAVGTGKVGDDGKKIPLDVKAGNKILFGKYSGSEVKVDDKEYLIMREEDVLAILE